MDSFNASILVETPPVHITNNSLINVDLWLLS